MSCPNLAATAAASPALLAGFDGMRRAVASTKLDPVLREIAGLAVGVAVDNRYGVAFHSTMLAGLGVDEADIDAIRDGRPPSGPRRPSPPTTLPARSCCERGKVADATVAGAVEAGLTTESILELVLEVQVRLPRRPHRQRRRPRRARRLPRTSGVAERRMTGPGGDAEIGSWIGSVDPIRTNEVRSCSATP